MIGQVQAYRQAVHERKMQQAYCELWQCCGRDDSQARALVARVDESFVLLSRLEVMEFAVEIAKAGGWDAYWLSRLGC